jgi:phospholipid-binding lipoprotein MlaA
MSKYLRRFSRGILGITGLVLLSACSHQITKTNPASDINKNQATKNTTNTANIDPFEKYNRAMFQVNTALNNTIFEPIVSVYDKSVPSFGREVLHNFFSNIQMFPTIGNDLLQGNFRWAGRDCMRLVLNTTLGGLGVIDVASSVGLYSRSQSFGLTLGKWGVQDTPYLVLPILGPSSVRGTIGLVPDFYMTPINYMDMNRNYWILKSLQYLQIGSDVLPKVRFIMENSLDPYVAMRNAYTQNQHYLLEQVKTEQDAVEETAEGSVQFSPMAEGSSRHHKSSKQSEDPSVVIETVQGASTEVPEVV